MVPVSFAPFTFAGQEWRLVDGRALFWPAEAALVVADLHLEKASHLAARGTMLPPYDSRETLSRLAGAIRATGARRVYALGDSFHDDHGPARMEPHAGGMLAALTRALDFVWIAGNHDGDLAASGVGGTRAAEISLAGMALRHQALPGASGPELSGHFHPCHTVVARGRRIRRHCAVLGGERLVLPAFGALTGSLAASDPAIRAALAPARRLEALIGAGDRVARFAL